MSIISYDKIYLFLSNCQAVHLINGNVFKVINKTKTEKKILVNIAETKIYQIFYPSSVIPDINSSFVNSHWVAALNFHAVIKTSLLSADRFRSSKNFIIPSAVILSVSCGS